MVLVGLASGCTITIAPVMPAPSPTFVRDAPGLTISDFARINACNDSPGMTHNILPALPGDRDQPWRIECRAIE